MEDIIRHAVLTLVATPGCTMLDMLPMLTDAARRHEYVSRTNDPVIRHYWEYTFPKNERNAAEWTASTLNKLGRFLTNPVVRNIVAQPKSTFDFREVMDEGKILMVNLSKGRLGEDNAALLGSVLVGKILIAAMSRSEISSEERRQFHLIVDEYHSFATESFPTLQSEARKFAIDTIVAHQYRDQLDQLNRGSTLNVGNFIIFRITGHDAREIAMQFDNCPPEGEPKLQAIPYRTGRDGVYRTSKDKLFQPGSSRSYSDVEHETANFLTNSSNYQAYCKFIEDGELVEHHIATRRVEASADPRIQEEIRANSRALCRSRQDVEAAVAQLWTDTTAKSYELAEEPNRPRVR